MVKRYLLIKAGQSMLTITLFSLLMYNTHALSSLEATLSTNQVELGKPVELLLRSSQTSVSFDSFDLSEIKTDFHIKNISDVIRDDNSQILKITLYPRRTGQLSIPALYFSGNRSEVMVVNVSPAIDPKDNTVIDVKYSVSTLNPWLKQQVLVNLELTSQSSIIVLNTPEAYSEYSDIFKLDSVSKQHKQAVIHTAGWALFPRKTGRHITELPAISLIRDGVTTHRFYPPLLQLDIKPLPVYIPATMPVGRLEIDTSKTPWQTILTNTIYNKDFVLRAYGVIPAELPTLSSHFKSNEALQFYPAEPRSVTHKTVNGINTEHSYTINFKANQQGINNLPPVMLNYFDPASGKITTLQQTFDNMLITSLITRITILAAIAFIIVFLAKRLYRWLQVKWQSFSGYRQVCYSLSSMEGAKDIKHSLMDIAKAEQWHPNLSLQQWQTTWSDKTGLPCPVNIAMLESMLYGGRHENIDKLKRDVQQLCVLRWPMLRLFKY